VGDLERHGGIPAAGRRRPTPPRAGQTQVSGVGTQAWAVVLAGGKRVRLSGLTRHVYGEDRPKQYAALTGGKSLLRQTLERVSVRIPSRRTVVVTMAAQQRQVVIDLANSPSFERRQAISYSISTLLTRNLHDVFGENDPARRRAAIDEIYTEECVFYDPSKGVYRGRDEIDRVAGAIRATHPDFRYQPIAKPEELGNGGRVQWVSGRPDEAPAYAGTDFIIARDGRIAALYLFFDKLP
jgi:hypothetical protein